MGVSWSGWECVGDDGSRWRWVGVMRVGRSEWQWVSVNESGSEWMGVGGSMV